MDFYRLEKELGYVFTDKELLSQACRHSSYVNEQPDHHLSDNERLEFLGDAVLNLIIGHLIMNHFPGLPEGDLSRMRAALVNETYLAGVARGVCLGDFLWLGKGEIQTGGRDKNSILADALEAVIAGIYLDGGFDAAFAFVQGRFAALIESSDIRHMSCDYKSALQEWVQAGRKAAPVYDVIFEKGPDHDKTFVVRIEADDQVEQGEGKSKKAAEQDAARRLLKRLEKGR